MSIAVFELFSCLLKRLFRTPTRPSDPDDGNCHLMSYHFVEWQKPVILNEPQILADIPAFPKPCCFPKEGNR